MTDHVVSTIPAGRLRGKHPLDRTVAELEESIAFVEAKLCANGKYKEANPHKRWVREATRLLQQRKFPTGSYSETEAANRALRDAAEVGHLLSPLPQVARVIDGCAIVISAFRADVQLDTFADDDDPRRRVPAKAMLDRLAGLLGISWDADKCTRTDNQSNPYLRSCQVGGYFKELDGTRREIQGHGEIDLSKGSALYNKILSRFDAPKNQIEIERRRQFILAHADTNARLRAIKQALPLRDTYLPADLAKPFFCARALFHGQSENAATKAVFDSAIAGTFLPSVDALFGPGKRAAGGDR